jgi:transposase
MKMLSELEDVALDSVRLDRYYSASSYVHSFDRSAKVFIIPKKNATLNEPGSGRRR